MSSLRSLDEDKRSSAQRTGESRLKGETKEEQFERSGQDSMCLCSCLLVSPINNPLTFCLHVCKCTGMPCSWILEDDLRSLGNGITVESHHVGVDDGNEALFSSEEPGFALSVKWYLELDLNLFGGLFLPCIRASSKQALWAEAALLLEWKWEVGVWFSPT